jgi:hypothetical protein
MTCLQRQRKAAGQFRIFLLDALPAAEFGDCRLAAQTVEEDADLFLC